MGYTFHIASELGSAGSFAVKRIEDIIVQADEVDGRYLQFEGGLSVTSTHLNFSTKYYLFLMVFLSLLMLNYLQQVFYLTEFINFLHH